MRCIYLGAIVVLFGSGLFAEESPRRIPMAGKVAGEQFHLIIERGTAEPFEMDLIWCPPGKFMYGYALEEKRVSLGTLDEVPAKISEGFWIGQFEVTRKQWVHMMSGFEPWDCRQHVDGVTEELPATDMTSDEAEKFCWYVTSECWGRRLLDETHRFQLPTELQWEYAARAGTHSSFSFGNEVKRLDEYGWYGANSCTELDGCKLHFVGKKKPNPWQLYDVHGNVHEWCKGTRVVEGNASTITADSLTVFREAGHMIRGGGCVSPALHCRCASNYGFVSNDVRQFTIGFRVALVPKPQESVEESPSEDPENASKN